MSIKKLLVSASILLCGIAPLFAASYYKVPTSTTGATAVEVSGSFSIYNSTRAATPEFVVNGGSVTTCNSINTKNAVITNLTVSSISISVPISSSTFAVYATSAGYANDSNKLNGQQGTHYAVKYDVGVATAGIRTDVYNLQVSSGLQQGLIYDLQVSSGIQQAQLYAVSQSTATFLKRTGDIATGTIAGTNFTADSMTVTNLLTAATAYISGSLSITDPTPEGLLSFGTALYGTGDFSKRIHFYKQDGSNVEIGFSFGSYGAGTAFRQYCNGTGSGANKLSLGYSDNTTGAFNELMGIYESGYTTIGTTIAATTLVDVYGSGRFLGARNPTEGMGVEVQVIASTGSIFAYDRTADVFRKLTIDGSILALNVLGGNVGIGTTSPLVKLDMPSYNPDNSTVRIGSLEIQPYNLNDSIIADNVYYDAGNGRNVYRNTGFATRLHLGDGSGNMQFDTAVSGTAGSDATSALTTKMTILNNGNVGISTNTPSNPLHVKGVVRIQDTATTNSMYFTNSGGFSRISDQNDDRIWIDNSTGNVGIGNGSPTSKLDVKSTGDSSKVIRATDELNNENFLIYQRPGGAFELSLSSSGLNKVILNAVQGGASYIDNGGNFGVGVYNPEARLVVKNANDYQALFKGYSSFRGGAGDGDGSGEIRFGNNPEYQGRIDYDANAGDLYIANSYANNAGDIKFCTQTNGTTNYAMTITGEGNIGVGPVAPTCKLDVTGGEVKATTGTFTRLYGDVSNCTNFPVVSTGTYEQIRVGTATVSLSCSGNASTVTNGVYTNSTAEGVRVGTATVSLSCSGNANTVTNGLYKSDGVIIGESTATLRTDFNNIPNSSYTWTGTHNFISNLGIGAASPVVKLDIPGYNQDNSTVRVGSLEIQPYSLNNTNIADNVYYDAGNGRNVYRNTGFATRIELCDSAGNIKFDTAVSGNAGDNANSTLTTKMTILNNGSVGISTNTPSNPLHVKGVVRIQDTATTNSMYFTNSGGFSRISDQNDDRIWIDNSTGNVGIGNGSPTSKLHTAGTVQVSSSAVSTASMYFAGAFVTLPLSGYNEGTQAYQTSDHKMYIATETVSGVWSWKSWW